MADQNIKEPIMAPAAKAMPTPAKVSKVVVEDAPPPAPVVVAPEEYISPQTLAEMQAGKSRLAEFSASAEAALKPQG